ncbi:MAG: ABC transporter ATP-binding protein/permease [Bacteroidia bacterium]|nr:ABC transporter ATP-binding protein/permease [Bacteroidia bacterium]
MQIEEDDFQLQKRSLGPFLKRIFLAAFQYKKWMSLLLVSALVTAAIDAMLPIIWRQYIDNWITPVVDSYKAGNDTGLDGFFLYGAAFVGSYLVQAIAIFGMIYAAGRIQEYVIYDLRNQMFRKLQYLSYSFYDKSAIGHLAIRLTADVSKVTRVISWGFTDVSFGLFMIIVSLTAMFWFNWKLSLIVMLSIPILLFLAIKVRTLLLGYSRKARKTYSQMAAYMTEHINGIEVNKTTVQEDRSAENFRGVTKTLRDAAYKSSFYSSMYFPIVVVTGSLAAALVIYLGGHLALAENTGVSVGIFAAFFFYAKMIFEPIFDITRYYASLQDALSAGERIFSLIDEPIEIGDREGLSDFHTIRGEIEFKDLSFYYKEDKPIFEKMNLKLKPGKSVALIGATGSGKTTLASLIARFYEPKGGELLIDGIDYRERKLKSYRSQLGIILQTPHLFSGTFRENLRYGKLDATDGEIKQALELIGIPEYGDRLDEQVGEEGGNLSAGEKQLISFARALLKDPQILIMDEATSSVDTLAEAKVQRGVDQMIKDRTAIIIAHRLSTIRNCDRILVMEHGKIIEDGDHESLLAQKGHYYQLYTQQVRSVE